MSGSSWTPPPTARRRGTDAGLQLCEPRGLIGDDSVTRRHQLVPASSTDTLHTGNGGFARVSQQI